MTVQKHLRALMSCIAFALSLQTYAQTEFDVSAGTSQQDNFTSSFALRKQISNRWKIGAELQFGSVKYRFIGAKLIEEGYTTTFSIPATLKLYETSKIRLDLFLRGGFRLQGLLDPDDNGERNSILNSKAVQFEAGLLVTVPLGERTSLLSGIILPNAFEIDPDQIYENSGSMVLAGISHKVSENKIFFVKTHFGPATGANGDTQKFMWNAQAGVRLQLKGKKTSSSMSIEPSY